MFKLLFVASLACVAKAEIVADEIRFLPGWDDDLPSRQFSGLLPIDHGGKHLHYWLVESEGDPSRDPLVLWLNGGPGASSLLGLFTELGPLKTNDDSTIHPIHNVPSLSYNPYSWAQQANLLFIESPAGVGFSYCANATACTSTDESTADDLAEFVSVFCSHYPELRHQPLYVTGESYAGVYLPMLAERLLKEYPDVPLAGLAAGNGCWGNKVGLCSDSGDSMTIATTFFHGHYMFDDRLWDDMRAHCDWYNVTQKCMEKVAEMRKQMGTFYLYNVYDTCIGDQATERGFDDWFELTGDGRFRVRPSVAYGLHDYECGAETAMGAYLANPKVMAAINVKPASSSMVYERTVADLRPLYKWLSDHIRVLVYSGDVDGCVPTYGTENFFLRTLGMPVIERWAPWSARSMSGRVVRAGYHEAFGGTRYGIDFVTFAGAGHMVPQYKGPESLALMRRWLANEPLLEDKMGETDPGVQARAGWNRNRVIQTSRDM